MNAKQLNRWMLDAGLLTSFILAFFLDLTGLLLHQWIGIAAAVVAAYHLISHRDWVATATRRFFAGLSNRSRMYYLVDGLLLAGLAAIILTGLVISSWLDLALAGYNLWRVAHVLASIGTLLLVGVKVALHWRWVMSVGRKIFADEETPRQPAGAPQGMGRRDFLKVAGAISLLSVIPLGLSVKSLLPADDSETQSAGTTTTTTTTRSRARGSAAQSSACCNRNCASPGRCRRYVDANGDNRCDLGCAA